MGKFFSVIFMNFWGFDFFIFIAAVVNFIYFYRLNNCTNDLYDKMHLTVFVPDGSSSGNEAKEKISVMRETDIVNMRNRMGNLYSVFINLTGIFPLLGILGTVVSLLGLVGDSSNVTGNFYGALTSTFWGLVFAIIFKFMDGIVSAKIEDNEKSVALYLERNFTSHNIPQFSENITNEAHIHISPITAPVSTPENKESSIVTVPTVKNTADSILRELNLGDDSDERLS